MTGTEWRLFAACKGFDPDLWFPEKGDNRTAGIAIAICNDCPVTAACLRYALDANERDGIWGGLTPMDRRHVRAGRSVTPRRRTITPWKDTE